MTQKAKHWLTQKSGTFQIKRENGGMVGSLIGLGYVEKLDALDYQITNKGLKWIKNQGVR